MTDRSYDLTRTPGVHMFLRTVAEITLAIRGPTTQDAICQDNKNSKGYKVNPDLQEPMA